MFYLGSQVVYKLPFPLVSKEEMLLSLLCPWLHIVFSSYRAHTRMSMSFKIEKSQNKPFKVCDPEIHQSVFL